MIIEELWQHSKVIVLLAEEAKLETILTQAQASLGQKFEYVLDIIDDQDWVKLTQSQFNPIKVNTSLYIVPSWHELPDKHAKAIILDPGLAFGTGSHPTTFMCLQWISKHVRPEHSVLDYGCGSGILAIAAKKFNASTVIGVDIDNQAIEASQHNASNNHVTIDFVLPNQLKPQQFDIVVANILSNPLRILAPALASLTKQTLILSGILDSQSDELATIYRQWFMVKVVSIMDGWVLLECNKK